MQHLRLLITRCGCKRYERMSGPPHCPNVRAALRYSLRAYAVRDMSESVLSSTPPPMNYREFRLERIYYRGSRKVWEFHEQE